MRRAERLFRLTQYLRGRRRAVTAAAIAAHLEVSPRTVYRDIAHLQASGLPIAGEAGVGYLMDEGFVLPPLTFTWEQIDALVIGMRAARALGDAALATAADEALAKIAAALPADRSGALDEAALYTPLRLGSGSGDGSAHAAVLRGLIRRQRKARLDYLSLGEARTQRLVRPLGLACFGPFWMLSAWCELRDDFRNFRLDRLRGVEATDIPFADEPGKTLKDYFRRDGIMG